MKKQFVALMVMAGLIAGVCVGQTNQFNRFVITPQQAQDAIPVLNAQIAEIDAQFAVATAQYNQKRIAAVRQRDQLVAIAAGTNAPVSINK